MENNSIITIIINHIVQQCRNIANNVAIANCAYLSLFLLPLSNIFNINICINSNANKQSCKNRSVSIYNARFLFLCYMLISTQLAQGIERKRTGCIK